MSRTILLADDSVTIQKVVELTFMEEDYEVVAVGSGEEALARLDEIAPDLVVADVHMPGPSGFEVCREVKRRRPEVPVLLLVGTFEPFDPAEGEAAGADRHLKKPFDSQELLQIVRELVPAEAGADADAEGSAASAVVDDEEIDWPEDAEELPAEPEAAAVAGESRAAELAAEAAADEPAESDASSASAEGQAGLSDSDVERVARRVVELLGSDQLREVAWEVVPDLAEVVIKERLRELESQVE